MALKNAHKRFANRVSNNYFFAGNPKREPTKSAEENLLAGLSETERKHVIALGIGARNTAIWGVMRSVDESYSPVKTLDITTRVYRRQKNEENNTLEE